MSIFQSKKNKYIALAVLCILGIICLQSLIAYQQPPLSKENNLNINAEKIVKTPLLGIFGIVYILLLAVGVGNIVLFIARKLKRYPLINIEEKERKFPLSADASARLIFLVALLVFTLYLMQTFLYMYLFRWGLGLINLFIILNLIMEAGVIIIVLKSIPIEFLNFRFKKEYIITLLRIYTAILPIILLFIWLNSLMLEKIGVKTSFNPAIELLIFLKDKILIFILSLEVVLIGPVAEELFFRGIVYKLLRKRYFFKFSAVSVSLLFAFMHRTPSHLIPLFMLSLTLCYLYEKTQNILTPIIFHSLYNSLNLAFLLALKTVL